MWSNEKGSTTPTIDLKIIYELGKLCTIFLYIYWMHNIYIFIIIQQQTVYLIRSIQYLYLNSILFFFLFSFLYTHHNHFTQCHVVSIIFWVWIGQDIKFMNLLYNLKISSVNSLLLYEQHIISLDFFSIVELFNYIQQYPDHKLYYMYILHSSNYFEWLSWNMNKI